MRLLPPLFLALLASAPAAGADGLEEALARADDGWARRAQGHDGARAASDAASRAVETADAAVEAHPESVAARWRLLRALFFRGEFAARDDEGARAAFDRAAEVAEESLGRLAARPGLGEGLAARLPPSSQGDVPEEVPEMRRALEEAGVPVGDAARLHFWAALAWGGWSRVHGLLDAVREGVAGRVYRNARVAAALEPGIDEGGPWRLLARLHGELPDVPFLSGWVDRARAVPAAERAVAVAPEAPSNKLSLALTLLDRAPGRREEALGLLEEVASIEPAGPDRVELHALRAEAAERLRAEGGAAR